MTKEEKLMIKKYKQYLKSRSDWRRTHKEQLTEYYRNYWRTHKEQIKGYNEKWKASHREQYLAYHRAYNQTHYQERKANRQKRLAELHELRAKQGNPVGTYAPKP